MIAISRVFDFFANEICTDGKQNELAQFSIIADCTPDGRQRCIFEIGFIPFNFCVVNVTNMKHRGH